MSQQEETFVPESSDLLMADVFAEIAVAQAVIDSQTARINRGMEQLQRFSEAEQKVRHDQQSRIIQLELRNNNQTHTINRYQTENANLRQQIINLEKRSSAQANTINELLGDVPQ